MRLNLRALVRLHSRVCRMLDLGADARCAQTLDTRSEDEKSWLNVTPEIADNAGPR